MSEVEQLKSKIKELSDEIKQEYIDNAKRELEDQLKLKAENGCCIVEHGWRISAEHEVKTLKAQNEKLLEVARFYANPQNWKGDSVNLKTTIIDDAEKYSGSIGVFIGGKLARQVLKELGE